MKIAIFSGRLTKTPELKRTSSGTPVCSFSIAVNGKDKTEFYDFVAWNDCAERLCRYMNKGAWIMIYSEPNIREWTDKQGTNKRNVEFKVLEYSGSKKAADWTENIPTDDKELPF